MVNVNTFWAKKYICSRVQLSGDCWIWKLSVNSWGYGRSGDAVLGERSAHRIAYRAFRGSIPKGKCVLHNCDNPRCCKPSHLFVGTQADNVTDMELKGRAVHPCGESSGMAKLNKESVSEIRASKDSNSSLARKYNVSRRAIRFVKVGATWSL